MPLFEFACLECGAEFEKLLQKHSDNADVQCPVCGSKKLEDKISSFASVSKGGASNGANCAPSGG